MKNLAYVLAVVAAACSGGTNSIPCTTSAECVQGGELGTCRPSPASSSSWCSYPDPACPDPPAHRWSSLAGDGLADQCVAQLDGGVIDGGIDSGIIDGGVDAMPADARVDAAPTMAPVDIGQFADLVLGQSDFVSNVRNSGGESASSMDGPQGVFSDGTSLWVADSTNARILQWDSLPIVNKAAADVVIGQASATGHVNGRSQTLLGDSVAAVFVTGANVLAADYASNRVLIWNPIPATNGAAADLVLGQMTFDTFAYGTTASALMHPWGMWSDGTTLIIADNFNNRVLIWTSFPTTNQQPADVVLGQPDFGMGFPGPALDPPTASSMSGPSDVFVDGAGRLFVVDGGNNRVMVWNSIPTTNGAAADYFIGQSGPTANMPNAGGTTNNIGLDTPRSVLVAAGSLFVGDRDNHRVLVWTPVPTASGVAAESVLGQDNFTTGSLSGLPQPNRLNEPVDLAVAGDKLFVVDRLWHRVLRYTMHP